MSFAMLHSKLKQYYSENAVQAREKFLESAAALPDATHTPHILSQHKGPEDSTLATDVVRIGPEDAQSVLLISSATHGVEGYAGSAIQIKALKNKRLLAALPENMAIVMVHAVNPYGFAHDRRVNEDNIDLNRNFIDWNKAPPADHPLSAKVQGLLLPERERWRFPILPLLGVQFRHGPKNMQAAFQQGQYTMPQGLFYGGQSAAWSNTTWNNIVKKHTEHADHVAYIDIHSGLGPYGHGEIILMEPSHSASTLRAQKWWGHVTSNISGTSVSAAISGDIINSFNNAAQNKEATSIALEFGTLDKISVLKAMAFDNWVHVNNITGPQREKARTMMRNAFAPNDPIWQDPVLERGEQVIKQAITGLAQSLKSGPSL